VITMLYRDVIDLISVVEGKDGDGFPNDIETSRQDIFANKKSVRSSEFYQASQSGYTLDLMFEIRSIDYENESHLDFNGKRYEIIRTYDKGEIIELVCQGR
jgi:SPP1 family predicted phage head-tail adaptor